MGPDPSELLPVVEAVGMGLEENIAFVKSQIDLYRVALNSANNRVQDCHARYRAKSEELRERQSEFRSLRQAIVQPSSAPSRLAIEEIIRLQGFLERATSLQEASAITGDELQGIAKEWTRLQERLKELPRDELTNVDTQKINNLQTAIQERLAAYGFRSFHPSEIILSRENLRPLTLTQDKDGEAVEKEITFEISASDGIRLKWAYYLSLLRLVGGCNHAGLVVFDEPGQQEIDAKSLYAFLQDGAREDHIERQIIISTSESLAEVQRAVNQRGKIVSFDGFILQPM